jgi:hypothetical protein
VSLPEDSSLFTPSLRVQDDALAVSRRHFDERPFTAQALVLSSLAFGFFPACLLTAHTYFHLGDIPRMWRALILASAAGLVASVLFVSHWQSAMALLFRPFNLLGMLVILALARSVPTRESSIKVSTVGWIVLVLIAFGWSTLFAHWIPLPKH